MGGIPVRGKGKAFLNRAVNELYPPGSTFKIFLAASALDRDTMSGGYLLTCRGAITIPNEAISPVVSMAMLGRVAGRPT